MTSAVREPGAPNSYTLAMNTPYPRSEAPSEATWNKEHVFDGWDGFTKEITSIQSELPLLADYQGSLAGDPVVLLDWLTRTGSLSDRLGKLLTYAGMAISVDTSDTKAKAGYGQAMGLSSAFAGAIAFAEPELMTALGDGSPVADWIAASPELERYERYFRALVRKAPYTLSAEVETVLGNLGSALGSVSQTLAELAGSDMEFRDARDSSGTSHAVGQGTFMSHYAHEDRELRRSAWESFGDGYLKYQNTFATGYLGVIKQSVFQTKERGYESVLHERLEPTGLPVQVFHHLIEIFEENLPVWHRYWEVKRRLLGLDQLRPWDRWAPLSGGGPPVSYPEAVDWICRALEPMGTEYVETLRRGALTDRWVDWAPNAGKRQGAFSVPAYPGTYPFIMMTYHDSVFSMSTLAHELGHSMHHHLIAANQPAVYNGLSAVWRSSSIAETASNFHQAMTRSWLRRERGDDDALMLAVVDEAMMNYHRYCFIMPTLARFELEVATRAQAGEPLNAPILGEIMSGCFARGYGDVLVDDRERTAVTWAQFQHLYRPFYTFQYAIGISAASIAADRITAGESGAVERYLAMLRSGYSLPAIDLFRVADIEMERTEPMKAMFARLESLVELLEDRAG